MGVSGNWCLCLVTRIQDKSCYAEVEVEIEVEVNLRPTVSRPVCPGARHPSGTRDQFFFLLEISFRQSRFFILQRPL
jgi:hypothetical protein